MKKFLSFTFLFILLGLGIAYLNRSMPLNPEPAATPTGRYAFEVNRLADPRTGEIPPFIRSREIELAESLPKYGSNKNNGDHVFKHVGPYNVGGRTRALAIDVTDTTIYFAGGVSGGMWRTTDEGQTWTKVSQANDHAAVSCIVQDIRPGKESTWYYGSGESIGNSASKSFSAYYRGSGIQKSTDGGLTWKQLEPTTPPPNKASDWDVVYGMAIDPSRTDSDIVYAAVKYGIMRSNDGGLTWSSTLSSSSSSSFTDVKTTSQGVVYAIISADGVNGTGFWRSPDGINWSRISPSGFPSNHVRTVMDIPSGNENLVFYYAGTPGAGADGTSLWKYEYLSGDGTGNGGDWTNLTPQIPDSNMNLFNGYCMVVKVKPDNPDVIFIGGNNLYRSLTGFTDTINVQRVGGYVIDGDTNYNTRIGYQHPDQQNIIFNPLNPDAMIASTDGGVHKCIQADELNIKWTSLNNGYVTSQFYAIGMDHGTKGSNVILGGLQDQGTYWTNSADANKPWKSIRGADGAYVAVQDGGEYYYVSTQYANIRRFRMDTAGEKLHNVKVMPPSLGTGRNGGWLFVHPFIIDPFDNNIMYLPHENDIWKNPNLAAADSGDLTFWQNIESVNGTITTISSSENKQGTIFVGTSSGNIYRIENAHTSGFKSAELISGNIAGNGYASCIVPDPQDEDKILVIFSNYNIRSIWYTENGGINWETVEGNLRGTPDPGLPEELYYVSNGPSFRWGEIVPTGNGNRYFVGTSIGLFSTMELNGDSTIWVQEGAESIGNVVVDMMDFRYVDNFMAVGTHGNGIYTTTVLTSTLGSEILESLDEFDFRLFPNPATVKLNIFSDQLEETKQLELFNMQGQRVRSIEMFAPSNQKNMEIDVQDLPSGIYFLRMNTTKNSITKSFVKR